jgi:hypothetical protein
MVNNPLKTKKIRGSFLFDLATYIQLVLLYARYHNMKRHTKLLTHIPNKKELHLTAHAATTVVANELPVYLSKSSICPMTLQYSDDKKQKDYAYLRVPFPYQKSATYTSLTSYFYQLIRPAYRRKCLRRSIHGFGISAVP